jgi:hypothetical protein
MTSVTGPRPFTTLRRAPLPGEIGHLGTCPLCTTAKGSPPCLACRDEMRARLLEMNAFVMVERALN